MPPTKTRQHTPPGGYVVCDGCIIQKVLETLYGDEDNCNPGLVKSAKETKDTLDTLIKKIDVLTKIFKWVFPGSLAALIGLILLIIQLIDKLK